MTDETLKTADDTTQAVADDAAPPSFPNETEYYRQAFDRFAAFEKENGGRLPVISPRSVRSLNWAAFFLGAFWYAWKGMWAKALVLAGAATVLGFILGILGFDAGWVAFAVAGWAAGSGNYDYYLLRRHGMQWWPRNGAPAPSGGPRSGALAWVDAHPRATGFIGSIGIIFVGAFLVSPFTALAGGASVINAVRQGHLNGVEKYTVGEMVDLGTDVETTVRWSSFQPEGKPDHFECVQFEATNPEGSLVIQFLVNEETDRFEVWSGQATGVELTALQASVILRALPGMSQAVDNIFTSVEAELP